LRERKANGSRRREWARPGEGYRSTKRCGKPKCLAARQRASIRRPALHAIGQLGRSIHPEGRAPSFDDDVRRTPFGDVIT